MKHVLDTSWVPDETKEKYGLKPIKGGYLVYSGVLLPKELRPFRSLDFTYPRWVEDEMNAHVSFTETISSDEIGENNAQPRDVELASKLQEAFDQGAAGFFGVASRDQNLRDGVLQGLSQLLLKSSIQSKKKTLVVTTHAGVAVWRQLLRRFGGLLSLTRVLVVEYGQVDKLIEVPAVARLARSRATKTRAASLNGKPSVQWDFVIFDNFQQTYGTHISSLTYRLATLAGLTEPYVKEKSSFVVFTASMRPTRPADMVLASQLFMDPTMEPSSTTKDNQPDRLWGMRSFIEQNRFAMVQTDKGWAWLGEPLPRGSKLRPPSPQVTVLAQNRDSRTCVKLLEISPNGYIATETLGEHFLLPVPIVVKGTAKQHYIADWNNTRTAINSGRDLNKTLATFMKKSNLTKQEAMEKWIVEELATLGSVLLVAENVVGARAYDAAFAKLAPANMLLEATTLVELANNKVAMTFDTVVMENVGMVKLALNILAKRLTPSVVLLPYLEDSLEEEYAGKLVLNGHIAPRTPNFDTFVKRQAAKTPTPNRLS